MKCRLQHIQHIRLDEQCFNYFYESNFFEFDTEYKKFLDQKLFNLN